GPHTSPRATSSPKISAGSTTRPAGGRSLPPGDPQRGVYRKPVVPAERIERAILLIRDHRVMLDADLAVLYGVPTKRLAEQVRRNSVRFPADFMFRLTAVEARILRSRIATSSFGRGWGGRRYAPYAFTEQGVAMLSSVLRSPRAVQVQHRHHASVRQASQDAHHE